MVLDEGFQYADFDSSNSTGVYGGVIGYGNGNEGDLSNLNNTFLRGLQATDPDRVAQFETLFPGHYGGRATHSTNNPFPIPLF